MNKLSTHSIWTSNLKKKDMLVSLTVKWSVEGPLWQWIYKIKKYYQYSYNLGALIIISINLIVDNHFHIITIIIDHYVSAHFVSQRHYVFGLSVWPCVSVSVRNIRLGTTISSGSVNRSLSNFIGLLNITGKWLAGWHLIICAGVFFFFLTKILDLWPLDGPSKQMKINPIY